MTQKSKDAYLKTDISAGALKVAEFIKQKDKANTNQIKELFRINGYSESSATGRISDCLDHGLIKVDSSTQNISTYVYVSDLRERQNLIELRKYEKFKNWLRKGMTEFKTFIPSSFRQWINKKTHYENQKNSETLFS